MKRRAAAPGIVAEAFGLRADDLDQVGALFGELQLSDEIAVAPRPRCFSPV